MQNTRSPKHGYTHMRFTGVSVLTAPLAIALVALCAPAFAAEPLYLASQLEVDADAGVSKELGDCPYAREFSEVLQLALKRDGATFATGSVPTAKGRSLKVELVDFSLTGNGFIGHRMNMKFKGALYQDGSKVASFTDRTDFDGNGMITACAQVRTFMVGEASQVAKWVRKPVDGQELKRWGD